MSNRKSAQFKNFFADKGFGFLKGKKNDVFFHINDSEGIDFETLNTGDDIFYSEFEDSRTGKIKAVKLSQEQ